jgi:nitroreductase
VFDAVRTRRSIRCYQDKKVEQDKLTRILDAARLSPSAANCQPWRFIVVTDPEIKQRLRTAYDKAWFASAPVIVVACAQPSKGWTRREGFFRGIGGEAYWKVDVAIAMQSLILVAWDEGLGSCWIGAFNETAVKQALSIPHDIRVLAMTPIGYPAVEKKPVVNRKALTEIVHYEKW